MTRIYYITEVKYLTEITKNILNKKVLSAADVLRDLFTCPIIF